MRDGAGLPLPTEESCTQLEDAVTTALARSPFAERRGLWCDGMTLEPPATAPGRPLFEHSGERLGTAWIGQGKTEMGPHTG